MDENTGKRIAIALERIAQPLKPSQNALHLAATEK